MSELDDLKEIAIAKIKIAFNRSIDIEATHEIFLDKIKTRISKYLYLTLVLCIFFSILSFLLIMLKNFDFLYILLAFNGIALILPPFYLKFFLCKNLEDHFNIIRSALELREHAMEFFRNKIDNLDVEGYIKELLYLESFDNNLANSSEKLIRKIKNKDNQLIEAWIKKLEEKGIKKQYILKEELNSAKLKAAKFQKLLNEKVPINFD
ncbi:MAG: hypothetical protein ACTSRH_17460 [Promethearchaeota archaeon]